MLVNFFFVILFKNFLHYYTTGKTFFAGGLQQPRHAQSKLKKKVLLVLEGINYANNLPTYEHQ